MNGHAGALIVLGLLMAYPLIASAVQRRRNQSRGWWNAHRVFACLSHEGGPGPYKGEANA